MTLYVSIFTMCGKFCDGLEMSYYVNISLLVEDCTIYDLQTLFYLHIAWIKTDIPTYRNRENIQLFSSYLSNISKRIYIDLSQTGSSGE